MDAEYRSLRWNEAETTRKFVRGILAAEEEEAEEAKRLAENSIVRRRRVISICDDNFQELYAFVQ